jgi:hypothetical protein
MEYNNSLIYSLTYEAEFAKSTNIVCLKRIHFESDGVNSKMEEYLN